MYRLRISTVMPLGSGYVMKTIPFQELLKDAHDMFFAKV